MSPWTAGYLRFLTQPKTYYHEGPTQTTGTALTLRDDISICAIVPNSVSLIKYITQLFTGSLSPCEFSIVSSL